MKSNQVSVLVVLLLCLVMGGFLYVVDRSSDDEKGWTPSELYSELGARSYEGSSFSDVTFSGGASSDGVAVSMRNGSFSLRTRASRASMPVVAPQASSLSLSGSTSTSSPNSLIGHMTSSAEFHSFGGGSNMAMGSYTSSSNSLIASSPAIGSYSQLPIAYNPIALSPNASGVGSNNLPSLQGGDGGRPVVSAEQALMSASSSASGLFGSALQNTYGTASYDQTIYGSYGSAPSGIRGRQNATPNFWDDWLKWLSENEHGQWGSLNGAGMYTYTEDQLRAAHAAWLKWLEDNGSSVTPGMSSFESWWAWMLAGGYDGYEYDGFTYRWVPIGNILPLLLIALVYLIILMVKRNKIVQL